MKSSESVEDFMNDNSYEPAALSNGYLLHASNFTNKWVASAEQI